MFKDRPNYIPEDPQTGEPLFTEDSFDEGVDLGLKMEAILMEALQKIIILKTNGFNNQDQIEDFLVGITTGLETLHFEMEQEEIEGFADFENSLHALIEEIVTIAFEN